MSPCITRAADCPAEVAQLMSGMNALCMGFDLFIVEQAAGNMLSCAIHNGAKMRGIKPEEFEQYAKAMLDTVLDNAKMNFHRVPQPADIPVTGN